MSSNSTSASGIMSSATKSPAGAKRVTKKTEEVAVAAPVAVAAAPAAPAATKSKKAAAAAAPAPVVAAAPVVATPAPVAAEGAVEAEEVRLETEAKSITARLLAVRETVSELISEAKRLEKKAAKVQKLADKRRRRKAVEGEPGKPARVSIFQVPTGLTPELCAFMGRPAGSLESRSNVTKFITKYVSDNNLKNKHDINGDAKLLKLLRLTKEDKLTYFNLQKYLNVHYLKADKPAVTA
jgi:chromatin remodeling complex protein RSC6